MVFLGVQSDSIILQVNYLQKLLSLVKITHFGCYPVTNSITQPLKLQ